MTPFESINITLGTAGHIDHGKTALVRLLTGCETDRLKAEKERGMSIDLGHAPCQVAGRRIGIVDVPGHEHFIKTMVAGAAGMDAVMLVVAADDGIMPQTREHMEILTLLGIRDGLVALTKIDRVDPARREEVSAELGDFLRGTFLESAPICPVSSVTGAGLDEFLNALDRLILRVAPRPTRGVFRLPLDRAFSAEGFGTVVAGIPVAGSAQVGDEIELLPDAQRGRIRRIEVYGQPAERVIAGQCAAINVGQWSRHDLRRGDVIARPGYFAAMPWIIGRLRMLERHGLKLKSGAAVKFHSGTAELNARIYPLETDLIEPGYEGFVQIRCDTPGIVAPGDPFLLRWPSPAVTLAGGAIVEAHPRRQKRTVGGLIDRLHSRAAVLDDPRGLIENALRHGAATVMSLDDLSQATKLRPEVVGEQLESLCREGNIIAARTGAYLHARRWDATRKTVLGRLGDHHAAEPASPGLTIAQLRQTCDLTRSTLDIVVQQLKERADIQDRQGHLALPDHRAAFAGEDAAAADAVEGAFRGRMFSPPSLDELAAIVQLSPRTVQRVVERLLEQKRLVRVEKLLFHAEAIQRAEAIVREHFASDDRLESVRFKYLLDTTRKFALPLLDHMDRLGVTRRDGNTRFLKR